MIYVAKIVGTSCKGCGADLGPDDPTIQVRGGEWHRACWAPHNAAYEEECKLAYARPDEPRTWGVKHLHGGQDLWWRDWGKGYTIHAAQAGLFSERFATKQNGRSRSSGRDIAVPPEEMRAMFERARDSAAERLSHFGVPDPRQLLANPETGGDHEQEDR